MTSDEFDDAVKWIAANLPLDEHAGSPAAYVAHRVDSYRHMMATLDRHLARGAKILDFGAGLCDKSALAQRGGYSVVAYDDFGNPLALHQPAFRERIVDFAARANVELHGANGALPFDAESFDMVMMHGVIEHLHDSPRELINDLVERLKSDGLLFITVPNAVNIRKRVDVLRGRTNLARFEVFYWYPGPWRGHVREYTRGDLSLLCRFLGLEELELHGAHEMLSVLPRRIRPFYLAATALFQGWRDSWCLVARKPRGWKAVRDVPPTTLHEILAVLNR
jgi:SAM-dependent methyltransferase